MDEWKTFMLSGSITFETKRIDFIDIKHLAETIYLNISSIELLKNNTSTVEFLVKNGNNISSYEFNIYSNGVYNLKLKDVGTVILKNLSVDSILDALEDLDVNEILTI